ncbi:MAG: ATP-binding protein [Desulfuromonadales bacterium]|nr:ATP-binding protein [Desulfuromonadales bacterium]
MIFSKFASISIRSQLLILATLLTLPALGIIVYSGLHERSIDYNNAAIESQRLADSLAAQQEALANEARLLCTLLAGLSEVKNRDEPRVQAVLRDIHNQSSQYVNILITDAEGYVWASALPSDTSQSLQDRRYFRNARETGLFSSGEYVISRSTDKPTLHMAYPLLEQGRFNGVIIIGFDLDVMRTILDRAQISIDANYVLVDHRGIIVNRGKDAAPLIGVPIPADALAMMEQGPDKLTFEFVRRDNDLRITTYRKLRLPGEQKPYMYIRAGISKQDVLAKSFSGMVANIATLFLFVVLSFLITYLIGKRSIVDRINILQEASQQLAGGDHNIKVASRVTGGELGRFAETFDTMARQLGLRERSLQEANRELEAFSYTLSHDLRSYLTRINLAGESLQEVEGERLGEQSLFFLQTILETCQRMDQLIATMLALAHVSQQTLQYQDVNLTSMAEEIAHQLSRIEPERAFHLQIEAGLQVKGDQALLRVALENLLSNAFKYTRGKTETHICFRATQQNGRRVFAISDNGTGFNMTEAERLFEPFQRLSSSKSFPGFGIGLTTVERIIKRHGGEIWAEAIPGEGATFYFTLL